MIQIASKAEFELLKTELTIAIVVHILYPFVHLRVELARIKLISTFSQTKYSLKLKVSKLASVIPNLSLISLHAFFAS